LLVKVIRSWHFILCQAVFIIGWLLISSTQHFDPSFHSLQLILLIETSFALPILLMNHGRNAKVDKKIAVNDYLLDVKMSQEMKKVLALLEELNRKK
jgi:uncharacterized membrane protein